MANEHIKEALPQRRGDKHINADNFAVIAAKANAAGKIPFAKEDIEAVRQVGSHTEIVLRQKPLPTFFANATVDALDAAGDVIDWGGNNYYIADAPYKHDPASDEHLITFLIGGRYAVDLCVQLTCVVSTLKTAATEMYANWTAYTNGDTSLNLTTGVDILIPPKHALAHTHGAAVASDLTDYYHRTTAAGTFYRHAALSFVIDPVEDLTDGELYFELAGFADGGRVEQLTAATTLRIIKIA